MNNILSQTGKDALDNFLMQITSDYGEISSLRDIAIRTIKHLQGDKSARKETEEGQKLQQIWYESLSKRKPDYSVYDTEYY